MLTQPLLEFVRVNAPLEGNFRVRLPQNYYEVDEAHSGVAANSDAEMLLRDYLLNNVVRPLIDASSGTRLYQTKFSRTSFGGEGARLPEILKKVQRHYELIKGKDPINSFERFWNGVESDGSRRGYVLFTVNDPRLDLSPIFSFCYDPGVMSSSNLRSTLGGSLYKSIIDCAGNNPTSTVILLGYAGGLINLTVFPGASIFGKRLEEAISSTRTYDASRCPS